MIYREHAPVPALAAIVERLWTLEGEATSVAGPEPVLPDGCPELIVHFGDAFARCHDSGIEERQPQLLVAGQLIGPLVIRPTGRISVLGVRLRPYGAAALLTVTQAELVGLTIGLDAVSPPLARAFASIRDGVSTAEAAVPLVQSAILAHATFDRVDARVCRIVDEIISRRGMVSTSWLGRAAGLTPRRMQRRFLDVVGLPPKRLARIVRFTSALRALERSSMKNRATRTAADYGYADQAHFTRDFRELAGCAPTVYLLKEAVLSEFFTNSASGSPRSRERG